jgi:hypothetical protein
MAKRKVPSLESRLIEACVDEAAKRARLDDPKLDTLHKAQRAMYEYRQAQSVREAATDALLAEREKGGKG